MSRLSMGKKRPKPRVSASSFAAVLQAIENIVGDDQCEVWDIENANRRFRGRPQLMHEKLSLVYRLAHSAQPAHSCYHVHDDWRALTKQPVVNP